MLISAAIAPITLDITTLFVVATCITALLGLFLLSAWMQERVRRIGLVGHRLPAWRVFGGGLEHRRA